LLLVGVIDKTNQGPSCCRDRMIVGLRLPMQSVSIATNVVSSNPTKVVAWGQILPRQVVWGARKPPTFKVRKTPFFVLKRVAIAFLNHITI